MAESHFTYTLAGRSSDVIEHTPDARPPLTDTQTYTVYEEDGEWVAECGFCELPAASGRTRRSVVRQMWGSEHRWCKQYLITTNIDEDRHYTYLKDEAVFTVHEHEPDERPAYPYDGRASYTVYLEGRNWLADCNRCGNWAAVGESPQMVVARMFDHPRYLCDDHLYADGTEEHVLLATIEDFADMARRHGETLAVPGLDEAVNKLSSSSQDSAKS